MAEQALRITFDFLRHYGYFAMLPLMIVEGAVATVGAAVLASLGIFSWPIVLFFSILGDLIGNVILYAIGYHWGMGFASGWGRHFGLSEKRIIKMEKYFQKNGGKTLFVVKSMAGSYVLAFITAGIVKMDFKKFFKYALLGAIVWSSFLVTMGYFYGHLWQNIQYYVSWTGFGILLVMLGAFAGLRFFSKKQSEELPQ